MHNIKHYFVGAGLPANQSGKIRENPVRGQARSYSYSLISAGICILLAGNLYAATPANNEPADEKQETSQQVKPDDNSKPPASTPAPTFTPSEKVGADSAVSFPVDI